MKTYLTITYTSGARNEERQISLIRPRSAKRPTDTGAARMVAAAPELLKALQRLVDRIEFYSATPEDQRPHIEQWEYTEGSTDMAEARAAIAKAKGGES